MIKKPKIPRKTTKKKPKNKILTVLMALDNSLEFENKKIEIMLQVKNKTIHSISTIKMCSQVFVALLKTVTFIPNTQKNST